ncbi:hypothetical protein OOZ15_15800 [Galbibacter sp. EGI 63066]|uniref:hypothetical protein n=1 Tax=Galbibacter sp. EGI 63066 TaxID=2993559 RepID=UPI002248DBE3|nr:hypothetical protein [Galbibacter sp. EGI 63066]MCX2681418.1 hypothetical protein [Galbibacter sp. EGI 63066]
MTRLYYITISLILLMFGCKETNKQDKSKIQLKYEIIPEDYDRNLYYVNWTDTLGLSEGYLPNKILKRPKEIWCFVTNQENDTLGYYKGLSMAQTFCYFQTTDSIVTLNFMIGLNMFPDKFENDSTGAKAYWEVNKTPIEFEPIKINIKNGLRKEFEVELNEK